MLEDQRCDPHRKFVFQRDCATSWISEKHSLGQGYEIHRAFLEDAMEEARD
jgi:hypothetical protein